MTIARYLLTAALIAVGVVWIGQGLNILAGSGMSGQPIFAVLGLVLVLGGAWLGWSTRKSSAA
jgi:LPXTG-motif cell wall-anchored protein